MATQTLLSTGAAVRKAMRDQHISQRKVAAELKVSQAYVSRRLTGDVDISVSELTKIALLLGMPVVDLLPPHAPSETSPEAVSDGAIPVSGDAA